jgi:hypothetical protein
VLALGPLGLREDVALRIEGDARRVEREQALVAVKAARRQKEPRLDVVLGERAVPLVDASR